MGALLLLEDNGNRGGQITNHSDVIEPALLQEGILLLATPGQDEYRRASDRQGCLDVADSIADQKGAGQVQRHLTRRAQQHAGARLPAVAVVFGAVGTIVDAVDPAATAGDLGAHLQIDLLNRCLAGEAAADDRLIADHDDRMAGLGQEAQGGKNARKKDKLLPTLDVIDAVLVDDAIAVQEDRPFELRGWGVEGLRSTGDGV